MARDDVKQLVTGMKGLFQRLELMVAIGGLNKEIEVTEKSFVQLIECGMSQDGTPHWNYHQTYVEKMTEADQKSIVGAYLGESIGAFKIIGIYMPQPGLEMITDRNK